MRLEIGPYPLDWDIVDQAIIRRRPGVIVLGELAANRRTFRAMEVACALKRTLFGLTEQAEWGWFWCAYAASGREADAWAVALTRDLLGDRCAEEGWHGGAPSSRLPGYRASGRIGARRW